MFTPRRDQLVTCGEQRIMAGSCEHGNEHFSFIKGEEFIAKLRVSY
jgi:hypothetical protein